MSDKVRDSVAVTDTKQCLTRVVRQRPGTVLSSPRACDAETWLGRGGFFHSDKMRIVEKFTRTGSQMLYEVTITDPEVLVEPWVMPARTLRLAAADTIVPERGSCTESEHENVSSQFRH